jgi:hypothetical protein
MTRVGKNLKFNLYVKRTTFFWDITPCSPLKVNRCFGGTHSLYHHSRRISRASLLLAFMLVSCLAYSLTLKVETIRSSETSIDFQRTERRYIPDDSTLYNHRCEYLKSYKLIYTCPALLLRLVH